MRPSRPSLDTRLTAWRADVAHESLRGKRASKKYVRGRRMACARTSLGLYRDPVVRAPMLTELLHGETFRVLDEKKNWAWGICEHDGYVGYVERKGLGARRTANARIIKRASFVFARADIKSAVRMRLSLGARLQTIKSSKAKFLKLIGGGYVLAGDTAPLTRFPKTLAARRASVLATARQFLHMPYLWGGRGAVGLDCSGLVQIALAQAGAHVRRDSDMQAADFAPRAKPAAGDCAFWPGHVALVSERASLLHASGHFMEVVEEPLAEALARLKRQTKSPARYARALT